MNRRLIIRIVVLCIIVITLLWLAFEFLYKGTVTIETNEQNPSVTITNTSGAQIAFGAAKSFRVTPGDYLVTIKGAQTGTKKQISVGSLGTVKVTLPSTQKLQTSLIFKTALYGAIPAGNSVIGYDPADEHIKRIDQFGQKTGSLTSDLSASQASSYEPELPTAVNNYQPYQHDQVIVSASGLLYAVSKTAIKEISVEGIPIDHTSITTPHFIIATQPQLESFIVGYKQDIFFYQNTTSKPQKIYTAKKRFDSLAYGKDKVGLYASDTPASKEDLRSPLGDYQLDLLVIDTARGNAEQTITGPVSQASFSQDGSTLFAKPRDQPAFLWNVPARQKLNSIETPLIAGPYWVSATKYLYSTNNSVWEYDTASRQATLVGELPGTVTSFYKEDAGSILVTTYNDANNAGVYRLSAVDSKTSKLIDSLNGALPYNDNTMSITYTSAGAPTILIQTRAVLNDANQLERYRQDTRDLRKKALDYLVNKGVDLGSVAVTYDPADPL